MPSPIPLTPKYLVCHGANIQACNNCAVRWASRYGHLEVVKYLVSQGVNVQRVCYNWLSPVQLASENGHLEVVMYLVSQGASIKCVSSPNTHKYLSFCKKMEEKKRIKAQKTIYFWWIQICYDITKPCGKRMAHHNLLSFLALK